MSRLTILTLSLVFVSPSIAQEVVDLDAFLAEVRERGHLNVPLEHGRFLQLVAGVNNAQRVLEVGTSNGYSSLWIARALRETGGKLDTVEINEGRARQARDNFQKAGFDDIITLHVGDALKVVPELDASFDMIFLDAGNFKAFFDVAYPKLRSGGVLLTHNAFLLKAATEELSDAVKEDPQLVVTKVQIGTDGFLVCHKRRSGGK
jgi:predicted O-methyltransferase YrrM